MGPTRKLSYNWGTLLIHIELTHHGLSNSLGNQGQAHGVKKTILGNDNSSGHVVSNWKLTSSEIPLNIKDDVVSRIEERISAWTFLPEENSRPLQVMHFGIEEVEQNYNYFGNKSTLELTKPLMAIVVLYLSNVTRGGEILFPESELGKIWSSCTKSSSILRPTKGNAVLFFTLHPNATPDKSSSHARCPVLEGEMWYATKLFHIRSISGEKISLEADGTECTDEDENCPRWAAIGECQRNHVFMIGSPDYYGTCPSPVIIVWSVSTLREVSIISGLPAARSIEHLEILNDELVYKASVSSVETTKNLSEEMVRPARVEELKIQTFSTSSNPSEEISQAFRNLLDLDIIKSLLSIRFPFVFPPFLFFRSAWSGPLLEHKVLIGI
ncbi:hypothetical protein FH972_014183 [Carpinus fangiana]|uniref:procollagen-proline 4-dioxygenase n=1 Tax=Carpinus fangiana TaxID=176857 RepID=A0A5N6RAS9_9ROSI|nr:hypothetical protein FH972_014183 [Carpinus fangiana]